MIRAITFDLDMTLVDFMKLKRAGSDAAARAMVRAGLKIPLKQCKSELFGQYLKDIEGDKVFESYLKDKNAYSEKTLAAAINAYLKEKMKIVPYPNVKKTLTRLKEKGILLGIITDAPRLKAFMRLDLMGISDLFDIVVGYEDSGELKPSIRPFLKAVEALRLKPEEVMHVGDWPERDISGARNAGMKACLANYSYQLTRYGKYVEPDVKIENFQDIIKKIGEINRIKSI